MSKKRHISFWLTEEDMNGYQHQILMPVIFCKDCKYLHQLSDGQIFCENKDGLPLMIGDLTADDFCSRGELK